MLTFVTPTILVHRSELSVPNCIVSSPQKGQVNFCQSFIPFMPTRHLAIFQVVIFDFLLRSYALLGFFTFLTSGVKLILLWLVLDIISSLCILIAKGGGFICVFR